MQGAVLFVMGLLISISLAGCLDDNSMPRQAQDASESVQDSTDSSEQIPLDEPSDVLLDAIHAAGGDPDLLDPDGDSIPDFLEETPFLDYLKGSRGERDLNINMIIATAGNEEYFECTNSGIRVDPTIEFTSEGEIDSTEWAPSVKAKVAQSFSDEGIRVHWHHTCLEDPTLAEAEINYEYLEEKAPNATKSGMLPYVFTTQGIMHLAHYASGDWPQGMAVGRIGTGVIFTFKWENPEYSRPDHPHNYFSYHPALPGSVMFDQRYGRDTGSFYNWIGDGWANATHAQFIVESEAYDSFPNGTTISLENHWNPKNVTAEFPDGTIEPLDVTINYFYMVDAGTVAHETGHVLSLCHAFNAQCRQQYPDSSAEAFAGSVMGGHGSIDSTTYSSQEWDRVRDHLSSNFLSSILDDWWENHPDYDGIAASQQLAQD